MTSLRLLAVCCTLLVSALGQEYVLEPGVGDFSGGAGDGASKPDIVESGRGDIPGERGISDIGEGESDLEPSPEEPAPEEPAAAGGCGGEGQGCADLEPDEPGPAVEDEAPAEPWNKGYGEAPPAPAPAGEGPGKSKSEYAPKLRKPSEGAPKQKPALHNFVVTEPPRVYPKRFKCPPRYESIIGDKAMALDYNPTFYNKRGGSTHGDNELDCKDGSLCCWNNAPIPRDQIQFQQVRGSVNSTLWEKEFEIAELPEGDFLLAHSDCKPNATDTVEFVSCTIPETEEPTTISFKHWQSKNVRLRVCTRPSLFQFTAKAELENCQDIGPGPGPTEITIPPGKLWDIVFIGDGWKARKGEALAISDITAVYKLKPPPEIEVTTTTTTPEPTTRPPLPPARQTTPTKPTTTTTIPDYLKDGTEAECAIECDFEDTEDKKRDITMCAWKPYVEELEEGEVVWEQPKEIKPSWVTGGRKFLVQDEIIVVDKTVSEVVNSRIDEEDKQWRTFILADNAAAVDAAQNRAYGPWIVWDNRHTYVAAYLTPETRAPIVVETELIANRIIVFYWYTATQGMGMRFCCDYKGDVCPFITSGDVDPRDLGQWNRAIVVCPKGTTGMHMECVNENKPVGAEGGGSQGACAIDFIRMYKWKPGIDIDHAGLESFEPACPKQLFTKGKKKTNIMNWGRFADCDCEGPGGKVCEEAAAAEAEAAAESETEPSSKEKKSKGNKWEQMCMVEGEESSSEKKAGKSSDFFVKARARRHVGFSDLQ